MWVSLLLVCHAILFESANSIMAGGWALQQRRQMEENLSKQEEITIPSNRKRSAAAAKSDPGGLGPFSVQLYMDCSATTGKEGNLLVSPLSVATALAMTWEGAKGNTANQIERALQLRNGALQQQTCSIGQWFKATLQSLERKSLQYALTLSNRAFIQDSFKILPSYKSALRSNYRADVNMVNFMNPQLSSAVINDWVQATTAGHITQAVSPADIDELTQLILVNVLYFKGEWRTMFDPSRTRESNFYLSPREFVRVPMMSVHAEFRHNYFQEAGFQMVELPYRDGDVSMYIILPDDPSLFEPIQKAIASEPTLLFRPELYLSPTNITVRMPRLSFSNNLSLRGALQHLGVTDMFLDGVADLSGMVGNGALAVASVLQQVRIDVDEKGAAASAATAVVYRGRSAFGEQAFHVNKPYIYFIKDNKSKLMLFMGHVKNPTILEV